MTTDRRYTCNLCRDQIDPNSPPQRGLVDGTGIHFAGSAQGAPFKFVPVRDAENHICGSCIANIRRSDAASQSSLTKEKP